MKTKKMKVFLLPENSIDLDEKIFQNKSPSEIKTIISSFFKLILNQGLENLKDIDNLDRLGISVDLENEADLDKLNRHLKRNRQ